jgi:hypothetical protein
MAMFGTHLSPSTLIAKQWIANEYVASDLIFIGRRDEDWVEGYKPHVMEMATLKKIIASSITFLDLADTPDIMGLPGQILQVDITGNLLEFVDPINDFLDLLDTPIDYTGSAGYFVVVNPTEDGLIFQAPVVEEKRFEARMTFNSISDPVPTIVLFNNLPVTISWDRVSTGTYRANFSAAVNVNNLAMYINNSDTGIFYINAYNSAYIEFIHKDFVGIIDDANHVLSLEIKLYP